MKDTSSFRFAGNLSVSNCSATEQHEPQRTYTSSTYCRREISTVRLTSVKQTKVTFCQEDFVFWKTLLSC
jgi:hypothetical protein